LRAISDAKSIDLLAACIDNLVDSSARDRRNIEAPPCNTEGAAVTESNVRISLFPRRSAGTFYATSKIALIARASPPFDRHRRPHDGQQTPISKARWLCYGQRTSIDYIPMNSPFLGRKDWEAEVTKMIKVMGAPIKPEEVPHIVDYLSRHYGK
jgi:hypothetical protein